MIIGANLAAVQVLLKGGHVLSALFPVKRLGRGSACILVVSGTCTGPFSLMSNLHRGKQAPGFAFACLLLKSGSHMSMLATRCLLTDDKASLCHWCPLRHHHPGRIAREDQFCRSTSSKQLEAANGGTPCSRSSGGSHETGHSCWSQRCCDAVSEELALTQGPEVTSRLCGSEEGKLQLVCASAAPR